MAQFEVADYVVFGLTIAISLGIGVFYALSGGKQKTTSEYFLAGRRMTFLPVAISLLVSFESSVMILGLPAEAYVYGFQYVWWGAGVLLAQFLSIPILVPLLHPLKLTTVYEYLEYRFESKFVRRMGSLMGMMLNTWYMGIVLFGPALALEAVTGFTRWSSIFIIALVSVIYTVLGGIKAVIWTDVFQALVMFMGIFAVLIKGTMVVGGPKQVWDIAEEGGRLNFFNFDPDPRTRHTFWNLFFGSCIRWFGLAFSQSTVQRVSTTRSASDCTKMLLLTAPFFFISLSLACYEGVVSYSYYQTKQCDPLESGQITNPNQVVPFIVMDIFSGAPGMPGLFMASLFSASLSTVSSALSSMSSLMWADMIHPIIGNVSELKATIIAKISVVLFGVLACCVAILVSQVGGTLTQIAGTLTSSFAGPLTGMFFLACFFPRCKAKGVIVGGAIAFVFTVWIGMGQNFSPSVKKAPWLPPASTDRCEVMTNVTGNGLTNSSVTTMSSYLNTTVDGGEEDDGPSGIDIIYTLSYQWLAPVGIFGTIIIGLVVSLVTGMNQPGDVDPRYIINLSDMLLVCFPKRVRSYVASIGPQYNKDIYKENFPDPVQRKLSVPEIDIELKATKVVVTTTTDDNPADHKDLNNSPADHKDLNNSNEKEKNINANNGIF